jgi:hypothetical protein
MEDSKFLSFHHHSKVGTWAGIGAGIGIFLSFIILIVGLRMPTGDTLWGAFFALPWMITITPAAWFCRLTGLGFHVHSVKAVSVSSFILVLIVNAFIGGAVGLVIASAVKLMKKISVLK